MMAVKAFGWVTAAFGVVAALMVLVTLADQTADDATIRFLASAVLALVGVVIARRSRPIVPPMRVEEAEFQILRSARAHKGRVTATEIAVETALPVALATEMLEALARRGACRMSIAQAGIVVFEFPELEPLEPSARRTEQEPGRIAHARRARSQRRPS
jgi:hypothetical protein